jgi:type IV secretory pathway TrbD component
MKATARSPIRPKVASKPGVEVVVDVDLVVVVGSVAGVVLVVVVDLVTSGLGVVLVAVVVDLVTSAGSGSG